MKKTYFRPTIEVTDICTEECLLGASISEVTTNGLGDDPVIDQLIGGGPDGLPIPASPGFTPW